MAFWVCFMSLTEDLSACRVGRHNFGAEPSIAHSCLHSLRFSIWNFQLPSLLILEALRDPTFTGQIKRSALALSAIILLSILVLSLCYITALLRFTSAHKIRLRNKWGKIRRLDTFLLVELMDLHRQTFYERQEAWARFLIVCKKR